jgi:hypothetical protein
VTYHEFLAYLYDHDVTRDLAVELAVAVLEDQRRAVTMGAELVGATAGR